MSIEGNKDVVRAFFARLTARDVDGVLALLADDFGFWVAGDPESFALGGATNRQQYTEMLRNFLPVFPGDFEFVATGMTAEGDRVAVEATWRGRTVRGRQYHNRYHLLFVVRNGYIASGREYHDTLHAKQVLLDDDP